VTFFNIFPGPVEERPKNIIAFIILVGTFLVYNATKAPTLSFWDCGEFISCSYTLGIPHPPGSPLYIMAARVFSIIPFHHDICARINMLSAVTGAIAAMLAFLVTFKLIRYWWKKEEFNGWKKTAAYCGALVGASMFAFGRTHWNNSIEAEVYTPAMLVMMFIIYLTLSWIDRRERRSSDKYLWGIVFLGFLSTGIHMTTFLFMPAVFLIVILFSGRLRKDPIFYITGFCLVMIAHSFDFFMWATLIWLVFLIVATIVTRQYRFKFCLLLVVFAIAGFTCQLYTPIRSAQDPYLNQNAPSDSFEAFKSFLERKQYVSESMASRALSRRGEWGNQFGTFHRIGFWGFFYEQYGINYRNFSLLFVLGLLGLIELTRRRPRIGWPLIFMIVLGTVFLVWYMNFADGTMENPATGDAHIEVRDRDYFFTPGFILFGMAIGLGVAGLIEMARESFLARIKAIKTPVMIIVSALVLLAAVPLKANYFYCDRSRDYVPYDFAFNMLASCEPNAILFNAGDNDTFPIWCLQEVYKVRPDVTAINLALSNLPWYVKQIRDYMGIPLRWSDEQIAGLRHRMTKERHLIRIQDQVVGEMFAVIGWQRPYNTSQTMPEGTFKYLEHSLDDRLMLRGLVYTLGREIPPGEMDLEATHDLFCNSFLFRSLDDTTIYKSARAASLAANYSTVLILMADSLRKADRYEDAIAEVKKAMEIIPNEYQSHNFLVRLYAESGRDSLIPELIESVPEVNRVDMRYVWGRTLEDLDLKDEALEMQKEIYTEYPNFRDAFMAYTRLLYRKEQYEDLLGVVNEWLRRHPADNEAYSMQVIVTNKMREKLPVESGGN